MKRIKLSVLVLSLTTLSISACKKKNSVEKSGRKLDLVIDKIPVSISTLAITGPRENIATIKHRLNIDSLVKSINSNYTKTNLRSITLRSCTISIEDETVANSLGNFSLLNMKSLSADNKLFDIAVANDIKDTAVFSVTLLKSSSQELANFFIKDSISYQLSGTLRKALSKNMNVDAQIIYDINISE
jgi:hypothetical protein